MVDNVKLLSECQFTISRLLSLPFFKPKKLGKNYDYLVHKSYGIKFRLQFRKVFSKRKFIGYKHVEIIFAPHYHYNAYKHNGNDFNPINCIKAIQEILDELEFLKSEYSELKAVNLEFGFNLVLSIYFGLIINGLLFHSKTNFYKKFKNLQHYLITDSTTYKQIKVYAKGLHCHEKLNAFDVDKNALRIEVKSKQAKYIKEQGVFTANDLLNLSKYEKLMDAILNEWDKVLLLNLNPNFNNMKKDEVEFIQNANKKSYWQDLLAENVNRNKFGRHKAKYYKILKGENNLHQQIKNKIIDKIEHFKSDANSTIELQKETSTKVFSTTKLKTKKTINLEYAPFNKIIDVNKRIKEMLRSPRFQTHQHFVNVKQSIRSP